MKKEGGEQMGIGSRQMPPHFLFSLRPVLRCTAVAFELHCRARTTLKRFGFKYSVLLDLQVSLLLVCSVALKKYASALDSSVSTHCMMSGGLILLCLHGRP
jgi:hypothetical protein